MTKNQAGKRRGARIHGGRRPHRSGLALVRILGVGLPIAALLLPPATVLANGGTLRLANIPMGEYRVSVFTDPTPVRPDSLDVSVLVLRAGSDGVAEGVRVTVRAESLDHPGHREERAATRDQADDPRYYAAKFALGAEGRWRVSIDVEGADGSGSASFEVRARRPGPLGNPFVLVLLALLPLLAAGGWILRGGRSSASSAA